MSPTSFRSPGRRRGPRFREVRPRGAGAAGARPGRAARLPAFVGMTFSPHATLDRMRVMVVGAGSVGHLAALHLARLQPGEVRIVDHAAYKPESLLTHAALPPSAVGKPKALWCAVECKKISPGTRVRAFTGKAQSLPLAAFDGLDLVLAATDNLGAEIEVGERCARHGVPLVQGAVFGEMLVAQARFWTNRDPEGPCPACAFTPDEWNHVSAETFFRCARPAEAGPNEEAARENVAPTMSTSALSAMAAEMMVMFALRHALRLGPAMEDCEAEYCGYTHRTAVTRLERNPQCPSPHARWETLALDRPASAWTLRALARAALGPGELPEDLAFTVGEDLVYVEQVVCCGAPQEVQRFAREGAAVLPCARCGAPLGAQPFYSFRPAPAAVLGARLDRPLRRFGAASARAVVVHSGGRSVLCRREEPRR